MLSVTIVTLTFLNSIPDLISPPFFRPLTKLNKCNSGAIKSKVLLSSIHEYHRRRNQWGQGGHCPPPPPQISTQKLTNIG